MDGVTGVVLAAGAGRRFGGPKALARTPDGTPWLALAVGALTEAGCSSVLVVLGAEAEHASALVPSGARIVVAERWADGVGASLLAALDALAAPSPAAGDPVAALITLVDLPGLPAAAARRVLGEAPTPGSLRRAAYAGRPGHPVLIGLAHWPGLVDSLHGDRGAGPYLDAAGAERVECGDLWDGLDVDTRP